MKRFTIFALLVVLIMALPVGAQEETGTYFFTEDGSFAVYLPEGWSAAGDAVEGLQIGNPETPVDAMQGDANPQPGQAGLVVLPLPAADLQMDPTDNVGALELLLSFMATDDMPAMEEVTEFELGGRSAAMASGSNEQMDTMMLAFPMSPGIFGIAVLLSAPGELDMHSESMLSVLGTVSYSLPLDETLEDEATFAYPTGWLAEATEVPMTYAVQSAEGVLDKDALESGEFKILLLADLASLGIEATDLTAAAEGALELLREEGDVATEVLLMDYNGTEVAAVAVLDEADNTEGGLFVIADEMGGFKAVAFATARHEGDLIDLTALNMLLSLE